MKKLLRLGLLAMLLSAMVNAKAADQMLTVAVFDFESKDEGVRDLGPKVATLINANLSAMPTLITVERAELEKVVGEQELGLSGTVSPDTAARAGNLTGAKVLVTGRVFRANDDLIIVAKIIGSETSRVYGELAKGRASASISDLSDELAKKIAKTIEEKGSTLVATVEPRDKRIEKLVKSLKSSKRPAVSISIPERHFGGAVIDPAVETELSFILQKAGFTVVDAKSNLKPDIEITGEAFSAYGLRKGNLISCRSRIEVKVFDRASGKILVVDRQVSVAVDIAEQIAAKASLQNATDDLVERLLPKLTE